MDITIHAGYLPHDDPDASIAFYRDTHGFEVRNVGYGACGGSRSAPPASTASPSSCIRRPPTPGITENERRTIAEMMAKGTYASINPVTADLDGTFDQVQASGVDVVQEPTGQLHGIRDCAVRDPAGYTVRIQ